MFKDPKRDSRLPRILRIVAGVSVVGLNVGFALVGYKYFQRRRWISTLDVISDPVFAFPMVRYQGYLLPLDMYRAYEQLSDLKFREDDVIVASFPKSGTTWVQEIVYLLVTNLNFVFARGYTIEERIPYLEYVWPGVPALNKRQAPRVLKTHLPLPLLPTEAVEKAKIVYIARNPKDVAVSYYHFAHMFVPSGYNGSLQDFLHRFLRSQVLPYAPWGDHVRQYLDLAQSGKARVLFLTYEDLSRDADKCVRRLADFLDKSVTDDEVTRIVEHCRFDSMSRNPATNYTWWDRWGLSRAGKGRFMRKGKVGDWKNHLTEEESNEFDRKLEESGLRTVWEDITNR